MVRVLQTLAAVKRSSLLHFEGAPDASPETRGGTVGWFKLPEFLNSLLYLLVMVISTKVLVTATQFSGC